MAQRWGETEAGLRLLGLPWQNTADWMAYIQDIHSSQFWRLEVWGQGPARLGADCPLLASSLAAQELWGSGPFNKDMNPIHKAPPP